MDWADAKKRNPNFMPWEDADGDGLMNLFDSRPYNKNVRYRKWKEI